MIHSVLYAEVQSPSDASSAREVLESFGFLVREHERTKTYSHPWSFEAYVTSERYVVEDATIDLITVSYLDDYPPLDGPDRCRVIVRGHSPYDMTKLVNMLQRELPELSSVNKRSVGLPQLLLELGGGKIGDPAPKPEVLGQLFGNGN